MNDLTPQEMCDWANANMERVGELEAEVERLTAELAFEKRERIALAKAGDAWRQRIKVLEAKQKYLCDCLEAVGVDSSAALQAEPVAAADKERQ